MPNPFADANAIYHVCLVDTDPPDHPTAGSHKTVYEDELKWAGVTRLVNFCRLMDYGTLTPDTWRVLSKAHEDGEYQANELDLYTSDSWKLAASDRSYTGFNLSIEGPVQKPPTMTDLNGFEADAPNEAAQALIKKFEDFFTSMQLNEPAVPYNLRRNLVSTLRLWGYVTALEVAHTEKDQTPFDATVLAMFEALDDAAVAIFG